MCLLWVRLCSVMPYSLIIFAQSSSRDISPQRQFFTSSHREVLLTFLLLSRRCLVRKLSLLQGEKACCSWGLLLPPHSGRLPSGQTLRLCSLVQPKSWTLESNISVQHYAQNAGYAVWLNTERWCYVPAYPSYYGFNIHFQCSVRQCMSRISDNILRVCRVVEINIPEEYVGSVCTVYPGHVAWYTSTNVSETRDTDIAGTSNESVLSWHKGEGKTYLRIVSQYTPNYTASYKKRSGHIPHFRESLKSQRVINSNYH